MKPPLLFFACLLLVGCSAAQSVCRQATSNVSERHDAFTLLSISLPSKSGVVKAQAFLPNDQKKPTSGYVFSVSTLVGSDPDRVAEMLPAAVYLATIGRPAIMLERKLSWPTIDKSVGQIQEDVLCAEQWLSAHANVKADGWEFIGPFADVPTFEQLHDVGGDTSMVFAYDYSLGGFGDTKNTESVLRIGSVELIAAGVDSHE